MQRELETARRIQLSLLPRKLPEHPGLDIAARFVPMTAVAGDIYDVVSLGSGSIGLFVADVSGHGIPAALVASMVKIAFTAEAGRADDPAAVLTAMNQALFRHLEYAYVTAVYAVVNTERQTLAIATAGHPPPLLHRQGETSRMEYDHGVMLGVSRTRGMGISRWCHSLLAIVSCSIRMASSRPAITRASCSRPTASRAGCRKSPTDRQSVLRRPRSRSWRGGGVAHSKTT